MDLGGAKIESGDAKLNVAEGKLSDASEFLIFEPGGLND
jgi:hypothetical protein